MEPTKKRLKDAVSLAEKELSRALYNERAKIVARLRDLENKEMAAYIQPVFVEAPCETPLAQEE